MEVSYKDCLGVIATRYSFALLANIGAIILAVLAQQYTDFESHRSFPSFFTAMQKGNVPWFTLPVARLVTYCWE